MEPIEINIEPDESNNAYTFEVEVEYSRPEETKTTIVKGRVNFNDNGKFSRVRYSDGRVEFIKDMSITDE